MYSPNFEFRESFEFCKNEIQVQLAQCEEQLSQFSIYSAVASSVFSFFKSCLVSLGVAWLVGR